MKKEIENKTTEQLKSNMDMLKAITGCLIIAITLLLAISTYGLIMKDNNSVNIAGMFVALCLSAILPMQFISMNSVKTELKSRNTKN